MREYEQEPDEEFCGWSDLRVSWCAHCRYEEPWWE